MLTIFSNEKRRTGSMLLISKLNVMLKQEDRVSYVLRCEKDV